MSRGEPSVMGAALSSRWGVAALVKLSLCVSMTLCPELTQVSPCPMQPSPRQTASYAGGHPSCRWTAPYPGGQLHTIVEIPEPEEVSEAVSDVKGTQFLVSQSQKPENVHIVLVSPNDQAIVLAQGSPFHHGRKLGRCGGIQDSNLWALLQQTTFMCRWGRARKQKAFQA